MHLFTYRPAEAQGAPDARTQMIPPALPTSAVATANSRVDDKAAVNNPSRPAMSTAVANSTVDDDTPYPIPAVGSETDLTNTTE